MLCGPLMISLTLPFNLGSSLLDKKKEERIECDGKKKNDAVGIKLEYILVLEVMFRKMVIEHLMFENMIYNSNEKKGIMMD